MSLSLKDIEPFPRIISAQRIDELRREYTTDPHSHMNAVTVDLPKGDPHCPFCYMAQDQGEPMTETP